MKNHLADAKNNSQATTTTKYIIYWTRLRQMNEQRSLTFESDVNKAIKFIKYAKRASIYQQSDKGLLFGS